VLFNRFYQPDLDIEAMEVLPALELSSSAELRLSLRWIAILHRRWGVSLAASTGVHTAEDVVKVLLAGADVAMMTSACSTTAPIICARSSWACGTGWTTTAMRRSISSAAA
jgi:dihydroorotate dehydrogenase (fumarate)